MAKAKTARSRQKPEQLIKVANSVPKCDQVRVFRSQQADYLENKVNEWLKKNVGRIDIISREFVQEELGFRVVIWYRE